MAGRMSLPRFCKLAGVAPDTGRTWVQKGYITKGGDGKIDPFEVAKALKANIMPGELVADLSPWLEPDSTDESPDYVTARSRKEHYQAELARLDFEKRKGSLVEADWVQAVTASACTELRVTLELLPDSLSVELANQTDEAECRAILAQALELSVNAFEQKLAALAEIAEANG